LADSYLEFITGTHNLYNRYIEDWNLATRSYYGGVEYRNGRYLKAYDIDTTTPSETITTYDLEGGVQTGKYTSQIYRANSRTANETGGSEYLNSFYEEKIRNVPVFPYTRLYVSEYNSILFRNPPHRQLPDNPLVDQFISDVDGEGNSCNEFWSQVDTYSTVCGVVWVSCIKPAGGLYPQFRMYKPQDVRNWEYTYDSSGELILRRIVLKIASNAGYDVYQYITPDNIDLVFVVTDPEADIIMPDGAQLSSSDNTNYYTLSQPNELGYIPVRPVYQSTKIYNGIGHTPIFDIAQIQRSVYSDMGEIYSAVSYGSHPVNLVDEETAALNGGAIGAEPGTVIRVKNSFNGQPNFVYQFEAPPLDSIEQLRALVEQKIEKMNQVAMIRTDELIRASRSGAQLEQYDSKLEAFIRKKATSLENSEYQMWKIWFDWQNTQMPADFNISYNRQYNQRGLQAEMAELQQLMELYTRYTTQFPDTDTSDLKAEISENLAVRIRQLLNSSYTENSL